MIQRTTILTLMLQSLLFVVFFYLFGLPMIKKYEDQQVREQLCDIDSYHKAIVNQSIYIDYILIMGLHFRHR